MPNYNFSLRVLVFNNGDCTYNKNKIEKMRLSKKMLVFSKYYFICLNVRYRYIHKWSDFIP